MRRGVSEHLVREVLRREVTVDVNPARLPGGTQFCRERDIQPQRSQLLRAAVFSEGTVKYVLPPKELFRRTEELTALGLDVPLTANCVPP